MSYIRVSLVGLAIILTSAPLAFAQYITTEQQREQARQNLENHRQQQQNPSVNQSSGTQTTEKFGRDTLERTLQGVKPKTRTW
jgi:ABC-type dipeptide/oligopeptide/nickel transport system permease subunit